jgi:two-component system LytT family response regulator
MIKAIVVDDEPYAGQALVTLLQRHCPEVVLVAVCNTAAEAMQMIREQQPSLVFLDIEMPHMNGFELLEALSPVSFQVIFTTSYDQYAIRAIRFSALDYLLKPVDATELKQAVAKASVKPDASLAKQLDILFAKMNPARGGVKRIALPTQEGLQMIPVDSIIYCSASSNYTSFILKDKQKLLVSRTLKEIEEMLEEYSFLRVHHSCLVNLDEVKKYIRGEGGSLLMSDGSEVDVSRSRKDNLLKRLTNGA